MENTLWSRQDLRDYDSAQESFTAEGGAPLHTSSREGLMAQYGIAFDGRRYHCQGYQYDELEHAVAYVRLRQRLGDAPVPAPVVSAAHGPSVTRLQLEEMESLHITREKGRYRYGAFLYEQLADAVRYAKGHALQEATRAPSP